MTNNESFRIRQSKRVNDFPVINGKSLEEIARERIENFGGNVQRFSYTVKDRYLGLCKEIYTAKNTKKGLVVQKNLVIPEREDITPLVRNCYYVLCGMASGFHAFGFDQKDYTGRYSFVPYSADFDFIEKGFPTERVYATSLDSPEHLISLDPSLKYFAWDGAMDIIEYVRLYRKYPSCCEALMKFGLTRLIEEKALSIICSNKSLAMWVARNKEEIKRSAMSFQTAYNAYKKNPAGNPSDYQKSLLYRIEAGRNASFTNKEVYRKALRCATQERLYAYLKANKINSQSYGDYLTACDWLRLDFSDTKVLFPRNFKEVHDSYTAQYSEWKTQEEIKKAEAEKSELKEKMQKTAEKFAFLASYSADGLCVFVATSKADLIAEGSSLSHCVGRMDYDHRQADGKSVICFVRKVDDPTTPFVTVEVKINEKTLSVNQCYGYRDSVPEPEVRSFVDSWIKESNKTYRKCA